VIDTHGGADDAVDGPAVHVAVPERVAARVARLAFVMEQHLGHRTYADNLRAALSDAPDLEAHWVAVRYATTSKWWERVPVEGIRAALRGRAEVRRGLADIDVDACVFNTQVPAVLGGRHARRTPYVLCMDDTPRLMDSQGARHYSHRADSGPTGWAKYRYNRQVFRDAAGLAPWSNWARASLIDDYGVDPDRIEVIPPGVDVSTWQPADHVDDGPMKILFVGFDFERKGGEILLRAFETLPAGRAELRIVTQSAVPPRAGVEVHRGMSPNDPALRALFRTSDVFVLPSVFEMFGIAAVEAAAAGLPLIVTSVGGLGDLVVDGVTGFTMAPGDVDALAGHLHTLVEQPALRRKLGAAARQRAELEFDAGTNARRLVALAVRSAGLV
jgi:glycosyltransferase involved in cell wall biosynthesis